MSKDRRRGGEVPSQEQEARVHSRHPPTIRWLLCASAVACASSMLRRVRRRDASLSSLSSRMYTFFSLSRMSLGAGAGRLRKRCAT